MIPIELLFLVAGVVLLWLSAELLIWALQIISERHKISETFMGLSILSIGTSFPEIGTHIISSIKIVQGTETSGVAVGANIGSNIVQITLILGLSSLFMHVYAPKGFLKRDYAFMMGSITLLFLMSLNGYISRIEGVLLVALYLAYLRKIGKTEHFGQKIRATKMYEKHLAVYYFFSILGLVSLLFAANMVVENALVLSGLWHVEGSLIGALMIGFGTAMPEFAIAVTALSRKLTGMSVGVLIGSNITNPLFGIGIGAAISGYSIDKSILFIDIPVWFFVSCVVLIFFIREGHIEKKEAFLMLLLYLTYVFIRLKTSVPPIF